MGSGVYDRDFLKGIKHDLGLGDIRCETIKQEYILHNGCGRLKKVGRASGKLQGLHVLRRMVLLLVKRGKFCQNSRNFQKKNYKNKGIRGDGGANRNSNYTEFIIFQLEGEEV